MKADDPLLWAARIWTISGSILYYHGDSEGARIEFWLSFIESMDYKDACNKTGSYIPSIDEIEKILLLVDNFIESDQFRPYIKLMQQPKEFPQVQNSLKQFQ